MNELDRLRNGRSCANECFRIAFDLRRKPIGARHGSDETEDRRSLYVSLLTVLAVRDINCLIVNR